MGIAVKKVVSSLLLICLIITDFSPALADNTQTNSRITVDPTIFSDLNSDKYVVNPSELSEAEITEAQKLLQAPTRNILETMFLLKNLYYRVQMEVEKHGEAEVTKIISKRKDSQSIEFEVENVGKAEPLVINTERGPMFFTKVRHNELKQTILFIDKNQVDLVFLEESERLQKLGLGAWDKTLEGLSQKQIQEELKYRKFLLTHMRTLYARMLMSEWNPQLEYTPLSEIVNKSNSTTETEKAPAEVQRQVDAVLEQPISELKNQPWFKKLSDKSFDLWVDLAKQEKTLAKAKPGNESLMVVMFDGNTGEIEGTNTLSKPSKFTLGYWKMYWRAIWEKPAYREDIWKNSKGIGKMKVIFTGDYLMGLSFGVTLGGLSFLSSSLMNHALPEGLSTLSVALISFKWSLIFGVFSKTWQNFAYRGNDFVRFIKNWSTGLGQSYHFNLVSHESLSFLDAAGKFDPNAAKIHADILVNQSIKSTSKTSLQEEYRYRAKTGEAEGTLSLPYIKIKMPWRHNLKFMQFEATETTVDPLKLYKWVRSQFTIEPSRFESWEESAIIRFKKDFKITLPWVEKAYFDTGVPVKNFEGQKPQLVTTPIGLLSRFGLTAWGIPLGHILYAALGPIGEVRQINYKRKYADQLARNYGETHAQTKRARAHVREEIESWNSLKFLNIPGSQFVNYYVKVVPVKVWETVKQLSHWAAKKAAYYTYSAFEAVQDQLELQEVQRKEAQVVQRRYNTLMTVQNPGGKPHPNQILNGVKEYQALSCAKLFQ